MTWAYTYHVFESQQQAAAAIADAIAAAGSLGSRADFSVIGVMYEQGAQIGVDENGAPLYAQVAQAGWHVNAAWRNLDVPPAFAANGRQVHPVTPSRVFDGAPLSL